MEQGIPRALHDGSLKRENQDPMQGTVERSQMQEGGVKREIMLNMEQLKREVA